jgi:hypothetical protein
MMMEGQEGAMPAEEGGGNPAMEVAEGLNKLAEMAPSPEIKARIEKIMAELGDIATMMEGGELPEQAPGPGASPVGGPQARPVGPAGV